jgi:hypothetical protein
MISPQALVALGRFLPFMRDTPHIYASVISGSKMETECDGSSGPSSWIVRISLQNRGQADRGEHDVTISSVLRRIVFHELLR